MSNPLELPLRDIQLPQAVSWWPPAPGWWIVLGTVILAAGFITWWRKRQQRLFRSAVTMARRELESLHHDYSEHRDARRYVADLSVLLRRLSISAFPRTQAAGLTGEAWLQFLDTPLGDKAFSDGPGRILLEAPYRPAVGEAEIRPLPGLCQRWIDSIEEVRERQRP